MPYIKLPNDTIVSMDEHDYITVTVEVDLSEFINNDHEGVLALLSEKATGTELLSDISYTVIGHRSNMLEIKVTGCISDLLELEEIDEIAHDSLPLVAFDVEVTRIGYGTRTVCVSARTAEEAEDIADDDAGNHTYSEHHADYEVRATRA